MLETVEDCYRFFEDVQLGVAFHFPTFGSGEIVKIRKTYNEIEKPAHRCHDLGKPIIALRSRRLRVGVETLARDMERRRQEQENK